MPKFCIFYKLRNFSKKNTKTNISEKGMKINFKNTANIPSFYNKVDRKDFSIVSSNFYIFVSCYYKYPSHWIFPLLFTNFHIPCISSILFSLYIIFFFHGIFSIFIFQNLLYIYIHIFSLPDIKFFLSILSLFAGTLIFLIEPETFWFSYLVIHHRGYFYRKDKIHFHSFFDSIQIFPTFKLAPLSDITDEWRKGKKGRGMKRGMSEKKEKWRCRPGPANGLINKAPPRGILGPGRWWKVKFTLHWRLGGHIRMNRMIRRELARIAVLLRIPLAVNAAGPPQWNFSIEHSKLASFQKFSSFCWWLVFAKIFISILNLIWS